VPEKSVEGPKYHFGLKSSTSAMNLSTKEIPGPGQYSPKQDVFSTIGYSIGVKNGGGSFSSRDGPGPGQYENVTQFARIKGAATFGKHSRIEAVN